MALKINFRKSRNRHNDHKIPENINYTIVKYGETFYGRHTALIPAVVKMYRTFLSVRYLVLLNPLKTDCCADF